MVANSDRLINVLNNDPDWRERKKAARNLSKDQSKKAKKALLNAINDDEDEDVIYAAILSLVKLNSSELLDVVVKPKILMSENDSLRWASAYALGLLGNTNHIVYLNEIVHDSDWSVRNEAHVALEKLIGQLGNENDGDMVESIKLLIRMLRINHIKLNAQIVDILTKQKSKSYEILLEFLSSKNEYIKIGVIKALGNIKNITSVPHLVLLVHDELASVKKEVIKALGNIGGSLAINVIIDRLGDGNKEVVDTAIETIINIKDNELVNIILIDSLQSLLDINIRKNILFIMSKIKNKQMIPVILDNLGSSYCLVRNAAALAISKYGEDVREYINELILVSQIPVQPLIEESLNLKNINLRIAAIKALGEIKNPSAIEVIKNLTQDKSALITRAAKYSLKKILEANWARENAAFVLGELGGEKSIKFLIDATKDIVPEVRRSAISSLRKIRNSNTAELIADLAIKDTCIDVRAETVRALGDIGVFTPKIKDILIKSIEDKSYFVRSESARVLAKISDEKVIDLLINTLKDKSLNVRKNAQNALYTIGKNIIPKIINALKTTDNKYVKLCCLNLLVLLFVQESVMDLEKMLEAETEQEIVNKTNSILQILKSEYNKKNLENLTNYLIS